MTDCKETPEVYPEDQQPAIRRVMMPRDTNAVGTIFGGVILSEIDLAAAITATEVALEKRVDLPFGVSLYGVLRKPAA